MNSILKNIVAFLLGAVAFSASAAVQLFDFNVSDDGWKSTSNVNCLQRSAEYSADGERGLFFSGPAWDRKASVWPAFETRSVPKDWTKYDRLVIPVYNDSASMILFNIFIGDSLKPFRKGAHFSNMLSPYGGKQLVLPVFAGRKIDPRNIAIIHCYTENPESAIRLFIGGFTLLEPGEPVPALPKSYRQKILQKQAVILEPRLKQLEAEAAAFDFRGLPPDSVRCLKERVDNRLARFRSGEWNDQLLAAKDGTPLEWSSIWSLVPAMSGFATLRQSVTAAPGYEDVLLGYATPMEKVLPRVPVFRPLPETIRIEAAKNEKEAAQLIVMPCRKDRKKVGVTLTAFTGPAGTLPASALFAAPVGFVETTFVPYSGSEYVGFWPDPLLAFLDTVDVKAGEAQPFWIKADIPAEQPSGIYTGKAEVTIDGQTAFSIPVSIRVRDFALPGRSMLPLAVTSWPNDGPMPVCNPNFDPEARKSPTAPVHAWKKHKKEWRDLLAGYHLMLDSLYEYGDWAPEFDLLAELSQEGKLGMFNLGYFHPASENPANNYGMQGTIDRLRLRYEKAKQLGILKHAYIYGCDESTPDKFPLAERAAAILKKEFPDIPVFTTAYDSSFGMDGKLDSIDWFCPLTPKFNEKQAAAARKAGKQVWWYICLAPGRPYANNFIESSGIETRLLMGAMSAKFRPDGFLYYQTALWNNTAPITAGPYTDWIAQSFPNYNGDGNWTYPGPDGTPLGSIRLENFRDGLEDYAYVKLLEQRLAAAKQAGQSPQWQREAEAALAVPAALVGSLQKYTRDPQKVYAWRSRLAKLIEAAPVK